MKPISQMTQLELAAYVHDHLRQQGIDVVFSGGSVVENHAEKFMQFRERFGKSTK